MNSPIKIRKMQITDYEALIELWEKAKLPYKPHGRDRREHLVQEIQNSTAIFLVAENNNKIVGSVLGTHDGRKGWINRLAVDPQFRKQGIAKKLVAEVERYLDEKGIEIIACLIEDWNKASMQVFKKMGYKPHQDIIYFTKRKYLDV